MKKLPTTIVTGFLGSGKTTLLRHLISNANGRRLAVIVNEFGEVGVDGELLRQCGVGCDDGESRNESSLFELANGCLCCTVQDEFVPVLEELLERRDRIDHIIIETSGLALPKPLVQAFQWPQIKTACTVDGVISLVDGPAVIAGQFAADPHAVDEQRRGDPELDHDRPLRELFEDQLTAADLVVITKADELTPEDMRSIREQIAPKLTAGVKVVGATQGRLPLDVVLGLERRSEETIEGRRTHHDDNHEDGREHSHELFDTLVLRLPALSRDALLDGLGAVVREHAVLRAKGFAAVPDKPMRLVVQGVGSRFDSYFDRPWVDGEERSTQLVLIGEHLELEQVERTLLRAVGG